MKVDLRILAYNYIKEKILNNEYTSKQIISEKKISDELSISKTPVKEAFLYLESENFLVVNRRKSVFVKEVDQYRITMTAPLINQSKHIAFLVFGAGKSEAVFHI